MNNIFANRPFHNEALKSFASLTPVAKNHLKNVYMSLAFTMMAGSIGASSHFSTYYFFRGGAFISSLGALAAIAYLAYTRDTMGTPRTDRAVALGLVGFFSGMSISPLMQIVSFIDPSIPFVAFMGTCAVFACFTAAALVAPTRGTLYLGGLLASAMSILVWMKIINLFILSNILFQIEIYIGLLAFCGFVIFDTQMIIFKADNGDRDYIWHSVDLFLDFIAVFQRLMVILGNKKANNSNKSDKSKTERR